MPVPEAVFQVPERVLRRRLQQKGVRTIPQVLVQWSGAPVDQATWEDMEQLQQAFPWAPAWGQAGIEEEGIVNDPAPLGGDPALTGGGQGPAGGEARPKRQRRMPRWLTDSEWVVTHR